MTSARVRSGAALGARFIAVGVLNSAFHAGIVALLGLVIDHDYGYVAILIAWIVSLPFGYVTQGKLVWRRPLAWRDFAKLAVSQIPSIAISTSLGAVAAVLGWSLIWQEFVALGAGAVTSFVLQRFWVFRISSSESEHQEADEENDLKHG